MSEETMLVCLCVNDDYGQDTEYIDAIDFGEYAHAAITDGRMVCRVDQVAKTVKLGRKKFPIHSYGTWFGNMYWNAVRVSWEVAEAIATHISRDKRWAIDNGYISVWEAWEKGDPIKFHSENGGDE